MRSSLCHRRKLNPSNSARPFGYTTRGLTCKEIFNSTRGDSISWFEPFAASVTLLGRNDWSRQRWIRSNLHLFARQYELHSTQPCESAVAYPSDRRRVYVSCCCDRSKAKAVDAMSNECRNKMSPERAVLSQPRPTAWVSIAIRVQPERSGLSELAEPPTIANDDLRKGSIVIDRRRFLPPSRAAPLGLCVWCWARNPGRWPGLA